jgi:cysteine synthase A
LVITTFIDTPTSKFKVRSCLVGNTPLLSIQFRHHGRNHIRYAKSEYLSLTGRIKDRMALGILQKAYTEGKIEAGFTVGPPRQNFYARLDKLGARSTD